MDKKKTNWRNILYQPQPLRLNLSDIGPEALDELEEERLGRAQARLEASSVTASSTDDEA